MRTPFQATLFRPSILDKTVGIISQHSNTGTEPSTFAGKLAGMLEIDLWSVYTPFPST